MSFQRFSFVRPFTKIGKEGWPLKPAIVTYGKRGYEQRTYPVFPNIEGSPMKDYISKYQYKLIVNLWVVILYFEWVGKDRKPPNAAS